MNQDRIIPDDWRTDHLFVLVGGNPLPNYVAARLLLREGGCLHLVCSKDTNELAKRIGAADMSYILHEVSDPADPSAIHKVMNDVLNNSCQEGTIGLNYTGGTKAMSVHAYQAVRERDEKAVFTYLDARTLELRRDDEIQPYNVQYALKPLLGELLELHDISLSSLDQNPELLYPELNQALACAHTTKEGREEYARWCSLNLRRFKNKSQPKYDQIVNNIRATNEYLPEQDFHHYATQEIRLFDFFDTELIEKTKDLPPSLIPLPKHRSLQALSECMRAVLGLEGNYLDMEQLQIKTSKELERLVGHLDGKWVEYLTLEAFRQNVKACCLHDMAMSLHTDRNKTYNFEFDVAAMQGYQLYAISCTRDSTKGLCKSKLFEAYIRARQLGGDEARVALVCAYDDPATLQKEVVKNWGTDQKQIRVFGANHLPRLSDAIYDWLSE